MEYITQDDLLLYVYREASPEKTKRIQQLLITDTELQERFEVLKLAKSRLDHIRLLAPDTRSMESIFNHAERVSEELSYGK